jgi:predicted negative regulator of RcsB-dependent stress response
MNNKGFSSIVIVIIAIVIMSAGLAGWRILSKDGQQQPNTIETSQQSEQVEAIENSADVVKVEQELDSINFENDLDSSILDEDISSLQ